MEPAPLKTFIIYARADAQFKDELLTHLHPFVENRLLERWVDSDLLPGEEWEKRIEKELDVAHLVIMLVSADSLKSEFIRKKELKISLDKKRAGAARVVPILVRDCYWEMHPDLSALQLLPKDENGRIRGVAGWVSRDTAWTHCLRELKKLVDEIRAALQKEMEVAETARKADELKKQKSDEAKKIERSRYLHDEAFWKKTSESVQATTDVHEKITLLKDYLQDHTNHNHREKAEEQIEEFYAEIEVERIVEEARERRKAEQQQKEQEAARRAELEKQKRAVEQAENEQKRLEIEQQKKIKEAAHLAELKRQKEVERGLPEMVFVRGGTFQMGSKEDNNAKPIHSVTLPDFEIGKYPVTQKLWREIMNNNPAHFQVCDECPVGNVSWDDVQKFLQKLNQKYPGKNYRLPSEAEWEYAARGGKQSKSYIYAGSNDIEEVAWYTENAGGTHPVGSKKANELGIYDLSGNVWEWCEDHWHDNYKGAPADGSAWTSGGTGRVCRGGSWLSFPASLRVARRFYEPPSRRGDSIGFRLAKQK